MCTPFKNHGVLDAITIIMSMVLSKSSLTRKGENEGSKRQPGLNYSVLFSPQENERYANPHKAYTFRMHGFESVVGPVKVSNTL